MEFCDKLVDRFQDLSKVKNPSMQRFNYNYLKAFKRKCFVE